MNKKLFFFVLWVIAAFTPAIAQNTITVFDGGATNGNVPVYGFYADAYNKCEMIMPSADLEEMTGATLTKMTWYLATPAAESWGTANYQIYLKEVNETAFTTEFLGVEDATLVFEGPLDGTGETLEIEFANDFIYEGGNLLIAVYQTATGTYKSAAFAGQEVSSASISNYNYNSLEAITAGTARNFLPKTTFEFTPGGGVIYYKPKNVMASGITTNQATITWDAGGDETSWGVEYKKAADEEWTSAGTVTEKTVTLDALANATKYDVRVKSIYPTGESGWVQISFATSACEEADMGEIEYTLTDTYGDGWNGNKLQIYLAGTDVLIAELTIPHETTERVDYELTGTLKLCYGVDYDLVWVAGSYAYETGFELIGPEGETIYEFQGTGSSSGPVPTAGVLTTFQIHMNTCPRPTDVTASNITYNSATITWTPGTAEQDLWQLIYAKGEFDPEALDMVPIDVNEPTYALTGLEENSTYSVYVRSVCTADDHSRWSKVCTFATPLQFPLPEGLNITDITANSANGNWTGVADTYNFRYRPVTGLDESFEAETAPAGWTINDWMVMPIAQYTMGGTPLAAADGSSCMASKSMDDSGTSLTPLYVDNWLISPKVDLGGTLEFYVGDLGADYTENFSVYISTTGTATEDFTVIAENVTTAGVMVTDASAWAKKEFDLSAFEGQQGFVAIRHHNSTAGYYLFVDAVKIANENAGADWTVVEGTTSPVAMTGLDPLTVYEAQVQGIYTDGLSAWTESVKFTTLDAAAMPEELAVNNITKNSGEASWIGSQETYNIRYRKAAVNTGIVEDFTEVENGGLPEGWTVIDADGDGYNWAVWVLSLSDGSTQVTLSSNSYVNYVGALTPDNWVITPKSDKLGAQVSFDAWGQDPSYPAEHFQVYVNTGDPTNVDDFVAISDEIIATGTQTNYQFDLGEYAGEAGYIAIRHFNVTDQYILNVTNFYMQGDGDTPPGDWVVVEGVTSPYTIEGLDPETKYEVQVQGVVDEQNTTNWTESVFFTTLGDEEGMNEFYLVGTFNDWNQTEEGGRIAFVEEGDTYVATNVALEEGAEFKIITPDGNDGWIWFGGEHESTDYFLVLPEYYNNPTEITLVPNDPEGLGNFHMEYGPAVYKITLKKASNGQGIGPKALTEPIVMVMEKTTGIDNINVDKAGSNEWYNLNGQKLNGKPTVPGIYINGGKKVLVK